MIIIFLMVLMVYNLLLGKIEEVKDEELVFVENKSDDYILSVPHSGVYILSEFKDRFKLSNHLLIGSDLFTERLYNIGKGVMIISKLNNYQLNLNRFKQGRDSSMTKFLQRDPFQGRNLDGTVPLKQSFSEEEKKALLGFYDKYHVLIKQSIDKMKKEKDYALMFDCHSMSSHALADTPDTGEERADFVIGTLDDTSADIRIIDAFEKALKIEADKHRLIVRKNYPYKGGYILYQHANPSKGIHVLMLEVKKSLYMNEGFDNEKGAFKVKPEGLKLVNSIISKAFNAASEAAKNL